MRLADHRFVALDVRSSQGAEIAPRLYGQVPFGGPAEGPLQWQQGVPTQGRSRL